MRDIGQWRIRSCEKCSSQFSVFVFGVCTGANISQSPAAVFYLTQDHPPYCRMIQFRVVHTVRHNYNSKGTWPLSYFPLHPQYCQYLFTTQPLRNTFSCSMVSVYFILKVTVGIVSQSGNSTLYSIPKPVCPR